MKNIRKNYGKYIAIFLGLQALSLMMAFNRLTEFGQKGLPTEMITLIGMSWVDPFMIAFIFSVIACAMVLFFGYQDIIHVIAKDRGAIQRRYTTLSLMAISFAMVLLFVPYLL